MSDSSAISSHFSKISIDFDASGWLDKKDSLSEKLGRVSEVSWRLERARKSRYAILRTVKIRWEKLSSS